MIRLAVIISIAFLVALSVRAEFPCRQQQDSLNVDSLLKYAEKFLGKPYGNKGENLSSFDCSGYIRHIYGCFGVELPHSSAVQSSQCEKIRLKEVRPGDLLFFSGRKISKKRIGHVAMVFSTKGDLVTMIHATVKSGVILEVMQESEYFMKRFIFAGRVKGSPILH
ncbi:MAG: C40 family peptidase [Crocinitomicaceae bacterium]|nr:C40 family peptidase [Crocinitomicaceae bacterium]